MPANLMLSPELETLQKALYSLSISFLTCKIIVISGSRDAKRIQGDMEAEGFTMMKNKQKQRKKHFKRKYHHCPHGVVRRSGGFGTDLGSSLAWRIPLNQEVTLPTRASSAVDSTQWLPYTSPHPATCTGHQL